METAKGYYALIQYCPDHSRLEAANVGVILFCPERRFLDAQTAEGNDRVRRFFGTQSFDSERLNLAKRALEESLRKNLDELETAEDFQHFIDTRANDLVLSQPRPVKVFEPSRDLKRLFDTLVGGRTRRDARQPPFPTLAAAFFDLEREGRAFLDHTVKVPVLGRTLKVPYAYRNGALNLVKPEVFSDSESRAATTAARLAVEGDMLQKHGRDQTGDKRLIVVPAFEPGAETPSGRRIVLDVLREYAVRTVLPDQLPRFIEEVRQEAH